MILLSKNQQHQLVMERQAEADRYKNWLKQTSDELIEWCVSKNLTIADFENVINFTKGNFQIIFGKIKIEKK